jgi:hypothetical protein
MQAIDHEHVSGRNPHFCLLARFEPPRQSEALLGDSLMDAEAVQALVEKLKSLPPAQRAEVEYFVDFLRARKERAREAAAQRLGDAFRKLDALDQALPTADEVQVEIDAARAKARARRADRT